MASKRGHNEGSICQRSDGRWFGRVTVGYKDGKQVRKSLYGKTRKEVADKLARALADFGRGQTLPDEKLTLAAFLDGWLESTASGRLRPSTFARYKSLIELHVKPHIGRIAVGRLTPQQLQRLWTTLTADGLAARTVIQVRAVLRTSLNQAVRQGIVPRNVAALTDAPKATAFKPAFLAPREAQALLQAVQGHALEALVSLALTGGLRIGEILGLTWGDIDLEAKSLTVRQQQQRVGKELLISEPKTSRSARTIPLTTVAVEALRRHREMQICDLRSGFNSGHVMSGRVFTNERGAPLEQGTVLRQFYRFLHQNGLPQMRLHDLRHSCATLLLSKGIHPRVVMEILGHSTIAMTMNVYSHVVPEIARTAADAMDAVFSQEQAEKTKPRSRRKV